MMTTSQQSMQDKDDQMAYDQMARYAEDLGLIISRLKESKMQLERAYIDTVHRLAMAVEYKDEETGHHVERISYFSGIIAHALGLDTTKVMRIYYAAPMHDVGKISIPDAILNKPGRLDHDEMEIMKTHTTAGAQILANSQSEILETARIIALSHHEKWDGTGYPAGHKGDAIPIEGRIVCLADVFDALMSKRPYKQAFSLEKTLSIINGQRGMHFDPAVHDVFMDNLQRILEISDILTSGEKPNPESLFCSGDNACPSLEVDKGFLV